MLPWIPVLDPSLPTVTPTDQGPQTASPLDLNSIWVAGMNECPAYTTAVEQYWKSPTYLSLLNESAAFYASLEPDVLDGIFPNASVGYYNAYEVWDYVQYGCTHNNTVADAITYEDLLKLRLLADDYVFALTENITASGSTDGDHILAIAGKTLATRMIDSIYTNINTQGAYQKMTMFFGSFEPMMSFFALAGLFSTDQPEFYSIPGPGASMVIELLTLVDDTYGTSDSYPSDTTNLFVRFLYSNGTSDDAQLTQYPLFGQGPDNQYMSISDFVAGLEPIMMLSIEDWCGECGSDSIFCPAFEDDNGSSGGSGIVTSPRRGLSPALAGVIGALVTLIVLALIVGAAMLLLGLRFFRVKNKRRSELAGFKGEKLASDQDLTIAKGRAETTTTGGEPVRGHERVGSWELKDSGKAEQAQQPMDGIASGLRRASFEDDELHVNPYSKPVQAKDQL